MNDTITLIQSPRARLAKTVRADGTIASYDCARYVNLAAVPVRDLAHLADRLRRLIARPDVALVRGVIADQARVQNVRRLLHADPATGEAATLREHPRRWIALDLDGLPLPAHVDARDLPGCFAAILPELPKRFHGCAAIVQATASHGIKAGARLRVWFWMSRALTSAECRGMMAGAPVDRALFNPVQLHYTAAPTFVGMADPIPQRLAMIPGEPHVVAPPPPPPPPPPRRIETPRDAGAGSKRFAALVAHVRRAPPRGRHPALFWASCCAGEIAREGAINPKNAAALLVQAAMDAGGEDRRSAEKTALDGLRRGMGGV
jgi:hypothetical protein